VIAAFFSTAKEKKNSQFCTRKDFCTYFEGKELKSLSKLLMASCSYWAVG
jgi:hypothetical protein